MASGLEEDIVVAKVTSMIVLGGAAFVVTLLPVFVDKKINSKCPEVKQRNPRTDFVLSLCLAFGGGVLLCTTFLHLLPEVTESIETLQNNGRIPEDFPLPLPELIMCCGFFTMYIVEEVVHKFLHLRNVKKAQQGCDNTLNVSSPVLVDPQSTLTEVYKEILEQDKFKVTFSPPHEEDVKIIPTHTRNYGSSCTNNPLGGEVNHNHFHDSHYDHDHQHHHEVHSHNNYESGDHHTIVTEELPSLRELLIVLALTVHEGFEGLAIGLESSVGAVWYLMSAVAVHKCVIAFCIGVELVSGHISLPLSVFYAFIYSCASPFGIGIGLLLSSENDPTTALLSVVLQGMATGTLLYVVFFEILKRDSHSKSGLSQMVVVIIGFLCMAGITVIIDA